MAEIFCRFCGSNQLENLQRVFRNIRNNQFRPEVSYEKFRGSLGSITRTNEFNSTYTTKFCIICRNLDAADPNNPTPPLEAIHSDSSKRVIIPYVLATHLKSVQYEEVDMIKLIECIKNCLDKIYNKWSIDGLNPCKDEHMGKKITISLKHGVGIMCWVIVDSIKNEIYLRLSYGGNRITCPEN